MPSTDQKQLPTFKRITAPQYTPVPDYFLDEVLAKLKSGAQIQVYLFICRHTFGWKKNAEDLSLNFIAQGLGLKRNTVVKVTNALIKMNLIVRATNRDEKGGNLASTYALNMEGNPIKMPAQKSSQSKDLPLGDQNHSGDRGLQSPSPRGSQSPKTNTKEIKNKNNNSSVVADFLVQKGIGVGVAKRLAERYEPDHIQQKISYLEWKLEHEPSSIKKPAAWLRRAIEDDYSPPDNYKTAHQIAAEKEQEIATQRLQEVRRRREEQERQQKLNADEKAREEALEKLRTQQNGVVTNGDLADWMKARDFLKQNGYSPLTIAAMELLGLDRETGKLTIGVSNPVAYNHLLQSAMQAGLKRDLGSVLGIDLSLEYLPIRLDS